MSYVTTNDDGPKTDTRCGQCGSSRISVRNEVDAFVYGKGADASDLSVTVPVLTCKDCGFQFTDQRAETLRHEAVCSHLGVLSPARIREIRSRAGMTRERFAELTGFGIASLARWETGELIQNASHDRYLRLLEYPENLERLRRVTASVASTEGVTESQQDAKRAFKTLASGSRFSDCVAAALRFDLRVSTESLS